MPCREEIPTLDALQARPGGGDFHVLPLSIDRGRLAPVRRFHEGIGIAHPGLYLAEDIRAMWAFAAVGLPTTILVDRQGRDLGRLSGPAAPLWATGFTQTGFTQLNRYAARPLRARRNCAKFTRKFTLGPQGSGGMNLEGQSTDSPGASSAP